MDEPKSLDSLFKEKMFRIPDYQRGYAWQKSQLEHFWEDLINLSGGRSHYTGVLTLKEVANEEISDKDDEYWLVDDHSYRIYHIVDGQQRLTTFVVFLQAFIDFVRQMDGNVGKPDKEIYITGSLNLEMVTDKYLFKTKPTGIHFRTYKFGYMVDNPSYEYLRYRIFNEDGAGSIEETFYTLNLRNAKHYFHEQIKELHAESGLAGLQEIYKKLTKRFLFNEYVIKDDFDVFVAFETMNNRGKKLSDLELLKNRLIYLTTLYADDELEPASRHSLRNAINNAWKEVYYQLGRNDKRPLNDDDFLRAHWIMCFKYTKKQAKAYIKFLLDKEFSSQRVHKKVPREVILDSPEEQRTDLDMNDTDNENEEMEETSLVATHLQADLQPKKIKEYVDSLKESAVHWFNLHYPYLATGGLSESEQDALGKLSRIGMGYFRPLVMSCLKNEEDVDKRIDFLNYVERFIFIAFRLCRSTANFRETEFCNAAREFNEGCLNLETIKKKLNEALTPYFHDDGTLNSKYFCDYLDKKFNNGNKNGFYDWNGLRYFLYEYELSLMPQSMHKKISWKDFIRTSKDKVSIEHIFPQTPTNSWKASFPDMSEKNYHFYSGSIGNLLLLSMSINSSLQNDSFEKKKLPKTNALGQEIRKGYSNGSHSEIEISQCNEWTSTSIEKRGLRLLNFMEKRWNFKFKNEEAKRELLFLNIVDNSLVGTNSNTT